MPDDLYNALSERDAAEAGISRAPFSPSQVAALQARQANRSFHPYTCADAHAVTEGHEPNEARKLTPTRDGWRCRFCGYTQDWAHATDTEARPGVAYWNPGATSNGIFDAQTLTPYELLYALSTPPLMLKPTFRLVLKKTGHEMRRFPWHTDCRAVPYGSKEKNGGGDTPTGQVYVFNRRPVAEHIAHCWNKEREAEAQENAQRARARRAALYDLDEELRDRSGLPMVGTDRRLIAEARRRLWKYAEQGRSVGDALDLRALTPRLLLAALTGNGPLPGFVRFGYPAPSPLTFPWFPSPEKTGAKYATLYPGLDAASWADNRLFAAVPVVVFLERETSDTLEAEARALLRDFLRTQPARDYLTAAEYARRGL